MEYLIFIALSAIALNLINIPFFLLRHLKKKNVSYIPFVGGIIGLIIALASKPEWFWLPLVLDFTIPFYVCIFTKNVLCEYQLFSWLSKIRLAKALDDLAFYNDKGQIYQKHNNEQIQQVRHRYVSKIRKLLPDVDQVPSVILNALNDGSLETDSSGKYAEFLKNHRRLSAPLDKQMEAACSFNIERMAEILGPWGFKFDLKIPPHKRPWPGKFFTFTARDLFPFLKDQPNLCKAILYYSQNQRCTPAPFISEQKDKYIAGWIDEKGKITYSHEYKDLVEAATDFVCKSWKLDCN